MYFLGLSLKQKRISEIKKVDEKKNMIIKEKNSELEIKKVNIFPLVKKEEKKGKREKRRNK